MDIYLCGKIYIINKMKIFSKIKCPVCGCTEIYSEYNGFGYNLLPCIFNQLDDDNPNVPIWCNCPSCGCGIMFSSVWEEFAV